MSSLREGIGKFLFGKRADSFFLLEKYHTNLETQVQVHPGAVEDGSGHAWTDGRQKWSNSRWPYNAGSDPHYTDKELTYNPHEHCTLIGTSWWDYVERKSVAIGLDIDIDEGHAQTTTTVTKDKLDELEDMLLRLDYITLVRSKGGKGLHAYVFFDEACLPESNNHHEHKRHAHAVIAKISHDLGYDMSAHIDAKGLIMWIWADQIGTQGFELIRDCLEFMHPKELEGFYKETIHSASSSVSGYDSDGVQCDANVKGINSQKFSADKEHQKVFDALEGSIYQNHWVKEYNMMQTHTFALQEVHKALDLKGEFTTSSSGSQSKPNWEKVNCYITPRPGGVFKVVRFGCSGVETDYWFEEDGKDVTYFNEPVSLPRLLSKFCEKRNSTGSFILSQGSLQKVIDLLDGEEQIVPDCEAPIKVTINADGSVVASSKTWDEDFWLKVVVDKSSTASLPEGFEGVDGLCRMVISDQNSPLGWGINSHAGWIYPVPGRDARSRVAAKFGPDTDKVFDYVMEHPWTLVNLPFQDEHPGDRQWNYRAPTLKVAPSEKPGPHPTWDRVLDHIGTALNQIVLEKEWCQEWGIQTGGDYLRYWLACLFQHPFEALPYLFLYGQQDTGKTVFHEMLSLLIDNGIGSAKLALTNNYNSELTSLVLGYIEEYDLAKDKRTYNRIKELTTAKMMQIHPKGLAPYMQRNKLHFIHAANKSTFCPIEDGDTRIVVIEVPVLEDMIPRFKLDQMLEREASYFLHTLLSMDIPNAKDRMRIPVLPTSAKKDLELGSMSDTISFCHTVLYPCVGRSVRVAELFDCYRVFCAENGHSPQNSAQFRNQLSPTWQVGRGAGNQNHIANVSLNPDEKNKAQPLLLSGGRIRQPEAQ